MTLSMRRAFSMSVLSAPSERRHSWWGVVVDVTWEEERSGGRPVKGAWYPASAAKISSRIRVVIAAATLAGSSRKLGGDDGSAEVVAQLHKTKTFDRELSGESTL